MQDEARAVIAARGEEKARQYLEKKGYLTIARNWRCGRFGEIDIISSAQRGLLIFTEVKTRRKKISEPGIPSTGVDAIDSRKRFKIRKCAEAFLARHGHEAARFDVVVVTFKEPADLNLPLNANVLEFTHIEGLNF